jgi:hypothetical protein
MINNNLLNKIYPNKSATFAQQLQDMPHLMPPTVIRSDVENGFIIRYFVRLTNDKSYVVEVDEKQHSQFSTNQRFITTMIQWKIVGKKETMSLPNGIKVNGVEDINRNTVSQADLTFGGLLHYITSYLEYWFAEEV